MKKVEAPNPRNSHSQAEREALYFAAMMRVLDREMPGYAGSRDRLRRSLIVIER